MTRGLAAVLIAALCVASARAEKLEAWDMSEHLEAAGFTIKGGVYCENGKCVAQLSDELKAPGSLSASHRREARLLVADLLSGRITQEGRDRLLFLVVARVFGLTEGGGNP